MLKLQNSDNFFSIFQQQILGDWRVVLLATISLLRCAYCAINLDERVKVDNEESLLPFMETFYRKNFSLKKKTVMFRWLFLLPDKWHFIFLTSKTTKSFWSNLFIVHYYHHPPIMFHQENFYYLIIFKITFLTISSF